MSVIYVASPTVSWIKYA